MATSGSVNYTVNRDQIIAGALRKIGAFDQSDTIPSEDLADANIALNLLVKELMIDGLKLWKREEITVILASGTESYTLGPSGTANASITMLETEVKVAGVATDTSLDVDDTSSMTASDNIGIELDDGTIQWTTISSVTDSDTVVIATGLTSAAAVDNKVYFYTSKPARPQKIKYAYRRDQSDNDTEVGIISRTDYMLLSNKDASGPVTQIHYNPDLTNGTLYVWPATDTSVHQLRLLAEQPIEDFDAAGNNADFPQEWENALIWLLARELLTEYDVPENIARRVENMAIEKREKLDDYGYEEGSLQLGIDSCGFR